MIKTAAAKPNRTVRRTTAKWESNGEELGTVETEEITVLYYSPTIAELKAAQADIEQRYKDNPDQIYWLSETLVKRIHSLPDLKVGEGQPTALTAEWLESQDLKNLTSVKTAVEDDINPKS